MSSSWIRITALTTIAVGALAGTVLAQARGQPVATFIAHRHYVWRDGENCLDVTLRDLRTDIFPAGGKQLVRGRVEHDGSHLIRNVKVCGGGVCTPIDEGLEMQHGQVARFEMQIPSTDQVPVTAECSVREPAA